MKVNNGDNKQLKIPYKFDSRYVFKDSLVRIFRLINEIKSLEEIVMNTKLPYIFSFDDSPITFEYNLKELSSFDSYSEIVWLLSHKNILSPIKLYFNLTENTIDKTVLVVFELSIVNRDLVADEFKYKIITLFEGIAIDILKNLIIKLKNDNKDIYHYQSKIFNYSREKVLEVLKNWHNVLKEKGLISNIISDGDLAKEGTTLSIFICDPPKEIKLKIIKYKIEKKDIKWTLSYLPLDSSLSDCLIEWIILKLNDNQSLVTNTNKYIEQIEPIIFRNLTEKKIHMFEIMEEELKNKYK
jgi:hypothetical protein